MMGGRKGEVLSGLGRRRPLRGNQGTRVSPRRGGCPQEREVGEGHLGVWDPPCIRVSWLPQPPPGSGQREVPRRVCGRLRGAC